MNQHQQSVGGGEGEVDRKTIYEDFDDHRSCIQAAVKLKPEKIQARTGFKPMTSAIPAV